MSRGSFALRKIVHNFHCYTLVFVEERVIVIGMQFNLHTQCVVQVYKKGADWQHKMKT